VNRKRFAAAGDPVLRRLRSGGMVVSHSSVDEAVEHLRANGLRASAARRLVIEALFAAERPITAETIAAGLEGWLPASDLASVYRNLDTLETVGLVQHFHAGHGPGLYTVAGRDELEFVTCEQCGTIEAVPSEQLDGVRELIHQQLGYRARFSHFPIVGVCEACHAHS
jgi:Fe2+ or Zn2+ uptake regulation protein